MKQDSRLKDYFLFRSPTPDEEGYTAFKTQMQASIDNNPSGKKER